MKRINLQRFLWELKILEQVYGQAEVEWPHDYSWVRINNFVLPANYNMRVTDCIVLIPDQYGYGTKLENFYLNKNVRYKKAGEWAEIPHTFSSNMHNGPSYFKDGWRWLCIIPDKDDEDGICSFLKQIYLFLKYPDNNSIL